MSSYAATINIRHISTSKGVGEKGARNPLSVGGARKAALDNLSYITRASKADDLDIIGYSQGETLIAENEGDRAAMRTMSRWAIDARAAKHTDANGVRLADKMIVSLPADASEKHHREMVCGMLAELGKDSDAWLVAAIHRDRLGNPHAHILAIDGLETREAARARRPDAKRIRQRDQLRLNEGGNRVELRERIAAQINKVSDREGYRQAEIRSLSDLGVERAAQEHQGPQSSARRRRKEHDRETHDWFDASASSESNFFDELEEIAPPKRDASRSNPAPASQQSTDQTRARPAVLAETPQARPSPATWGPPTASPADRTAAAAQKAAERQERIRIAATRKASASREKRRATGRRRASLDDLEI